MVLLLDYYESERLLILAMMWARQLSWYGLYELAVPKIALCYKDVLVAKG